jgi:hypothetical protein
MIAVHSEVLSPEASGLAVHPSKAPVAGSVPQDFVSRAPQAREHVREAKRLAAYLNALRLLAYTFLSAICIAARVMFGSANEC